MPSPHGRGTARQHASAVIVGAGYLELAAAPEPLAGTATARYQGGAQDRHHRTQLQRCRNRLPGQSTAFHPERVHRRGSGGAARRDTGPHGRQQPHRRDEPALLRRLTRLAAGGSYDFSSISMNANSKPLAFRTSCSTPAGRKYGWPATSSLTESPDDPAAAR